MIDNATRAPLTRGGWLPVRGCVLGLVAALIAALWLYCGSGLREAWHQRTHTLAQERRAVALVHLAQWTGNLAFERGRTAVLLRGGHIDAPARAFLAERRRDGDRAADLALVILAEIDPAAAARLERDRAALVELRRRADLQMALPANGRDEDFVPEWFAALSAQLGDILAVVAGGDPIPGTAQWLTARAFTLREAAGREAAMLGEILAEGGPATAAGLTELGRRRGATDAAWTALGQELARLPGSGQGAALLAPLARGPWPVFRQLQDRALASLAEGRVAEVAIGAYLRASVPVLDGAAAVMEGAANLDLDRARLRLRAAERSVLVALAGMVAAALLGLALVVLLQRQLFGPGRRLRLYMRELADGRLDGPAPSWPAGRETADLASTAERLRQGLVERQQVQAQMARLAHLHRVVLDNAGDGLIGLGVGGRVVFANPAALRMLGWDWADLEGRNHHGLIHHSHADGSPHATEQCPIMATLDDGVARHIAHDLFWRKDGRALPVEYSVTRWADGAERGVVMVFHDVSARLAVEAEIDTLVQELRRSNTDLEQFAYAVSHDLQAPLRMVAAYVGLLTRALPQPLDPELVEYRDFITGGATRMAAMIAGLLDYARVKTRGADASPVDLGPVLGGVLESLAPQLTEVGGRVEEPEQSVRVMADPVQLGRVLQNLVGNALKYRRAEVAPRVTVSAARAGAEVTVVVADNGPGLGEGEAETVFGLFRRGLAAHDEDGLGMGLALCRRIIERLGGAIHAENGAEGGARFVFTLPAAPD